MGKISNVKRDFKNVINAKNDTPMESFECASPYKHKCLFHPKQLQQLPLSGIWISEQDNAHQFVLYEDKWAMSGDIIGYTIGPSPCRIHGKVKRRKRVKKWAKNIKMENGYQTMIQFEQKSADDETTSIAMGVIDDYNDEIHLEYVHKSESANAIKGRSKVILRRQDQTNQKCFLGGTWRLFKHDGRDKLKSTIFTVDDCSEDLLHMERFDATHLVFDEHIMAPPERVSYAPEPSQTPPLPSPPPKPENVPAPEDLPIDDDNDVMFIDPHTYEKSLGKHEEPIVREPPP